MNSIRLCGCKGCRTCLICEMKYGLNSKIFTLPRDNSYIYCPYCNKAWPGWNLNDYKVHPKHNGQPLEYPGVYINLNFLTEQEEILLLEGIDGMPWSLSQSGRRKQNFGPNCNFKKNKLREGNFNGFPQFTKFVQDKFREEPILSNFFTIEQCSLEYDPKRGASIDPHIDDCWIWGERIVTVNLMSDSVLTMTYNEKMDRYNLSQVKQYPMVLTSTGLENNSGDYFDIKPLKVGCQYPIVRIPMPRRSLLVLYNSARYEWEHQVLRDDIVERRICLAYREFTPPYLPSGEKYNEGQIIFQKAQQFWDTNLNDNKSEKSCNALIK